MLEVFLSNNNLVELRDFLANSFTFLSCGMSPGELMFKGTESPPERCDFTSSEQYNNNVL